MTDSRGLKERRLGRGGRRVSVESRNLAPRLVRQRTDLHKEKKVVNIQAPSRKDAIKTCILLVGGIIVFVVGPKV